MEFIKWKSMLNSSDHLERYDAAGCIPDAEDDEIIPLLINALDDPEDVVRINACESLGYFFDEKARVALRSQYEKETDDLVKGYCLEALGRIGNNDDIIKILKIYESTSTPRIKINAISGLVQGINNRLLLNLVPFLENEDYQIRDSSRNLIIRILHEMSDPLDEVREALIDRTTEEPISSRLDANKRALNLVENLLEVINRDIEKGDQE